MCTGAEKCDKTPTCQQAASFRSHFHLDFVMFEKMEGINASDPAVIYRLTQSVGVEGAPAARDVHLAPSYMRPCEQIGMLTAVH